MIKYSNYWKRFVFVLLGLSLLASCQPLSDPEITGEELIGHINYLASEELEGRFPGTSGDSLAADYIREQFLRNGLDLLGDEGYQTIEVNTEVALGDSNSLTWNRRNFSVEKDFTPLSFSGSSTVSGPVVFAGFGIQVDNPALTQDDYDGLDVQDKIVMLLEGGPAVEKGEEDPYEGFVSQRYKVLTAGDQGALAVILVAGENFDPEDHVHFSNRKEPSVDIPVIRMTREAANNLLKPLKQTVNELEADWADAVGIVGETGEYLTLQTDLEAKSALTHNIVGLLKSDHYPNDSIIIIGAHYDHLGWGGIGSGSRVPDTTAIHYGADDNASGVAGVIELAGKLNGQSELNNSFVFIAFAGEEMGLIGSKYFAENPLVPLDQVKAMINMDMIGRLDDERKLTVGGVGTALEFKELIEQNNSEDFLLALSKEGAGPSDHSSFYSKDKPVLYISTGAHVDYHTPNDQASKINVPGIEEVVTQVFEWVKALDQLDAIHYQEAGPKQQSSGRNALKVKLGIMPDVTGQSNDGLKVEFVTEGGPAYLAGLQKGDIITAMEGHSVGNVYDYMARLQSFVPGQTITVEVKRGNENLVFLVQLLIMEEK